MNMLKMNQFTGVEEPFYSTPQSNLPLSQGGHVGISNKACGYYIKGQKQLGLLGYDERDRLLV